MTRQSKLKRIAMLSSVYAILVIFVAPSVHAEGILQTATECFKTYGPTLKSVGKSIVKNTTFGLVLNDDEQEQAKQEKEKTDQANSCRMPEKSAPAELSADVKKIMENSGGNNDCLGRLKPNEGVEVMRKFDEVNSKYAKGQISSKERNDQILEDVKRSSGADPEKAKVLLAQAILNSQSTAMSVQNTLLEELSNKLGGKDASPAQILENLQFARPDSEAHRFMELTGQKPEELADQLSTSFKPYQVLKASGAQYDADNGISFCSGQDHCIPPDQIAEKLKDPSFRTAYGMMFGPEELQQFPEMLKKYQDPSRHDSFAFAGTTYLPPDQVTGKVRGVTTSFYKEDVKNTVRRYGEALNDFLNGSKRAASLISMMARGYRGVDGDNEARKSLLRRVEQIQKELEGPLGVSDEMRTALGMVKIKALNQDVSNIEANVAIINTAIAGVCAAPAIPILGELSALGSGSLGIGMTGWQAAEMILSPVVLNGIGAMGQAAIDWHMYGGSLVCHLAEKLPGAMGQSLNQMVEFSAMGAVNGMVSLGGGLATGSMNFAKSAYGYINTAQAASMILSMGGPAIKNVPKCWNLVAYFSTSSDEFAKESPEQVKKVDEGVKACLQAGIDLTLTAKSVTHFYKQGQEAFKARKEQAAAREAEVKANKSAPEQVVPEAPKSFTERIQGALKSRADFIDTATKNAAVYNKVAEINSLGAEAAKAQAKAQDASEQGAEAGRKAEEARAAGDNKSYDEYLAEQQKHQAEEALQSAKAQDLTRKAQGHADQITPDQLLHLANTDGILGADVTVKVPKELTGLADFVKARSNLAQLMAKQADLLKRKVFKPDPAKLEKLASEIAKSQDEFLKAAQNAPTLHDAPVGEILAGDAIFIDGKYARFIERARNGDSVFEVLSPEPSPSEKLIRLKNQDIALRIRTEDTSIRLDRLQHEVLDGRPPELKERRAVAKAHAVGEGKIGDGPGQRKTYTPAEILEKVRILRREGGFTEAQAREIIKRNIAGSVPGFGPMAVLPRKPTAAELSKGQPNYTPGAWTTLMAANRRAHSEKFPGTDSLHILQEMLAPLEAKTDVPDVLKAAGANTDAILASVRKTLGDIPKQSKSAPENDNYLAVALQAVGVATDMGAPKAGPEHVLLAMLRPEMEKTSTAEALRTGGLTYDKLKAAIEKAHLAPVVEEVKDAEGKVTDYRVAAGDHTAVATLKLADVGRDLTEQAREGKLDPVIGRKEKIERVLKILGQRQQNNPVLVGESGVGLTTVMEGVAQRIASGDVPPYLRGKKLMFIQVSDLVAGTKHRGEFEARMKAVLTEVAESKGQIILCIDGLETVIGAGGTDGGSDMSTMLNQAIKRDKISVISSTSPGEFRKKVEKSKIAGNFQKIDVFAPEKEEALHIVEGASKKYEEHHGVTYTPEALKAAVELSDRYLYDKEMPSKALSLIDAAASDARYNHAMRTPEKMERMWTEYEALKRENPQSKKIAELWKEMEPLTRSKDPAVKNSMKLALLNVLKRQYQAELEHLTTNGKKEEATQLQSTLESVERDIAKAKETAPPTDKVVVTLEDIEAEVERRTGIPVGKRKAEEVEFSLHPEEKLRERVVGQEDALKAVSNVIKNIGAQTNKPGKPLGSMLLLGTTGTGKTALAKALAELKFGDKDALIKIDMSEYMDKSSASRLVGAAPGYVGYEEGGQLTEKVRRHPYGVVLLDELEKAAPEVRKVFLQMLDEGRLTDGQGRLVKFDNVIIVGTTNVGAALLVEMRKNGAVELAALREKGASPAEVLRKAKEIDANIQKQMKMALEQEFSPELVARFQNKIIFNQLTRNEYRNVVEKSMRDLQNTLGPKKLQLKLQITDEALDVISQEADVDHEGARGLENIITNKVQPLLSEAILTGQLPGNSTHLPEGSTISIIDRDGQIHLEIVPPGQAVPPNPPRTPQLEEPAPQIETPKPPQAPKKPRKKREPKPLLDYRTDS